VFVVVNGELVCLEESFAILQGKEGLIVASTNYVPDGAFLTGDFMVAVIDDFEGAGEGFACLSGPTSDFVEGAIAEPFLLVVVELNGSVARHDSFGCLVDCVGMLAAERLCIELGGMRFYLGHPWPKSPEDLPQLLGCLDYALCKMLIDGYPLPVLEVPVCGRLRARNRMIVRLRDRAQRPTAIAGRFGRLFRNKYVKIVF
jgi:hypothetical protein